MNTKKLLAAVTGVTMLAGMLTACGSSSDSSTASSSDPNTLTIWAWDDNFNVKAANLAKEYYQKEHPDVTVNVVSLDIYHTVLLKDVIMRNQIRNVPFLENLVRFLADNTGKLISANSISKYMKSQGESIASAAIINYISFLCEAYILHKVNRYDIHGKRIFETNDKFYFEDNGIRNAIAGGTREGDIEKVIENIIYQNLIRLGYQVYVGQLQAGEIDFVCTKPGGERIYVQASYIIADDATREREFGNLRAIKDNYPKYVISMTPLLTKNDDDGITHLHLRKFLTEGI